MVYCRAFEVAGGIAILAAKQACVVHADIFANDAPAGLALGRIFLVPDFDVEGLLDVIIVNTLSGLDVVGLQLARFSAGYDLHIIPASSLGNGLHHGIVARAGLTIMIDHANALLVELSDALAELFVHIHHTDHRAMRVASQSIGDEGVIFAVKLAPRELAKDNGIIAPDHSLRANAIC